MNFRKLAGAAAVWSLLAMPGVAEETRRSKLWRVSLAALGGATAADMASSFGKQEVNPLMEAGGGRFSAQSVALKASLTGAAMFIQWRIVRKSSRAQPYAGAANLALAGVLAGAAAHNMRTPGR
jgi:hypothetical protein